MTGAVVLPVPTIGTSSSIAERLVCTNEVVVSREPAGESVEPPRWLAAHAELVVSIADRRRFEEDVSCHASLEEY